MFMSLCCISVFTFITSEDRNSPIIVISPFWLLLRSSRQHEKQIQALMEYFGSEVCSSNLIQLARLAQVVLSRSTSQAGIFVQLNLLLSCLDKPSIFNETICSP